LVSVLQSQQEVDLSKVPGFRDTHWAGTRCVDALESLLRRYIAEESICISRIDAFAGISGQGPGQEALE
jgi:hypothetical protein